ncbi:MAG: methylenetetrahydrofolate reductase [NAD(P)H] [Flavobacteriales bacterium]|nr:methylenetetrahydrofolate reductase [NAD(P)H] [Flavobacteriales bacterium]MCX7768592.1 methylenetetrahydrofolate reductase [NAD(P)H] [Flavobacteriales bacterium]MDW8409754.1 methylenetetrahydrofolate reductase [NAD(P)H] [Flavobacteriales bacterium]
MKIIDKFNEAKGRTLFSFEILPPPKGRHFEDIQKAIEPLLEFEPAYINVTYHREEYVYKKREKGYLEKVAVRKRPGTVGICAAIKYKYNIDTVPHLICGGFTKEETENALIDLSFLGIDNVLALRGDPVKTETHFVPTPGGHTNALGLVQQISNLGKGIYLDEDMQDGEPLEFCIGVAAYPEKHVEAPNLAMDIEFLKKKIEAGASYAVTQLFFDNRHYFRFVEACRQAGITVPIIPGIKPISRKSHLTYMPKFFHVEIPEVLARAIERCSTDKEVEEVGTEWAIQQCKELIKAGVPSLHFYTMGRSTQVQKIARQIF